MSYNQQIKADPQIFANIRVVSVDEKHVLKPIMLGTIDKEAMFYMLNSASEEVKKYLPTVFADNPIDARKKLINFSQCTLLRQSILYCIRDKKQPFPLGYIHIASALSLTGLNDWSVDFWIGEISKGKGLMSASLEKLLDYMAVMKIDSVKALVDKDNIRSVNVLNGVGFIMENHDKEGKRILMSINLKNRIV